MVGYLRGSLGSTFSQKTSLRISRAVIGPFSLGRNGQKVNSRPKSGFSPGLGPIG